MRLATALPTPTVKSRHLYITRKKAVCGGKPIIAGTRLKVSQIAIEYERLGWTPTNHRRSPASPPVASA